MNYLNKFAFISICVCTFLALGQNNAPTKSCTGSEKCADRDHTLSHWKYIWNKKQLITDKRWSLPKFWVLCLHLSVPRIIWSTQIFFFFFFQFRHLECDKHWIFIWEEETHPLVLQSSSHLSKHSQFLWAGWWTMSQCNGWWILLYLWAGWQLFLFLWVWCSGVWRHLVIEQKKHFSLWYWICTNGNITQRDAFMCYVLSFETTFQHTCMGPAMLEMEWVSEYKFQNIHWVNIPTRHS